MKWRARQVKDGEWLDVPRFVGCCDCGLVHRIDYRLKVVKRSLVIQVRNIRHHALTRSARRRRREKQIAALSAGM